MANPTTTKTRAELDAEICALMIGAEAYDLGGYPDRARDCVLQAADLLKQMNALPPDGEG